MMLASQALTTNAASNGRLILGIGLSHQVVIEGMWGYSFDKPARHMREYLTALMPLLRGEGIAYQGETLTARGQVAVPGGNPMPVVLAALAPRMLERRGRCRRRHAHVVHRAGDAGEPCDPVDQRRGGQGGP